MCWSIVTRKTRKKGLPTDGIFASRNKDQTMEQPQNPLDNQDPLDDPLFDALEHSIENPPGFADSSAERSEQLM